MNTIDVYEAADTPFAITKILRMLNINLLLQYYKLMRFTFIF